MSSSFCSRWSLFSSSCCWNIKHINWLVKYVIKCVLSNDNAGVVWWSWTDEAFSPHVLFLLYHNSFINDYNLFYKIKVCFKHYLKKKKNQFMVTFNVVEEPQNKLSSYSSSHVTENRYSVNHLWPLQSTDTGDSWLKHLFLQVPVKELLLAKQLFFLIICLYTSTYIYIYK